MQLVLIGKFNTLKIVRKASFGYYLDAETGKTKDDILLPKSNDEEDLSLCRRRGKCFYIQRFKRQIDSHFKGSL